LCSVCVLERAADAYAEQDRALAERRHITWQQRSAPDARLVLFRQHRHRTLAKIRPTEPLASFDPWAVASDALDRCRALGRANPAARREVERVAEAIRRLAWGPDEGGALIVGPRHRRHELAGQMWLFPPFHLHGQGVDVIKAKARVRVA
jgi:hypothetical protein